MSSEKPEDRDGNGQLQMTNGISWGPSGESVQGMKKRDRRALSLAANRKLL